MVVDNSTNWHIGEEVIPQVPVYGVMRYIRADFTPLQGLRTFGLKHKLASWIDKIWKFSRLKPHQRVSLLRPVLCLLTSVPRLIHTLKFAPARGVFLDELDRMVRKGVKDWCKLSPSATDGILYSARRNCCLAIPKISTNIDTVKASSIDQILPTLQVLRTFGLKLKLASWINKIGKFSGLKPHQRVSLLSDYAVPRLIHTLKFAPARGVFLDELDRMVRKGVKDWCKLSPSATDGVLYAARKNCGLAIPKISAIIDTAKASSINRLRKSALSVLSGLPEDVISSIWGSSRKRKAGSNWRKTEVGMASGTRIWIKTLHGFEHQQQLVEETARHEGEHLDKVLASPALTPFRHELFC
ncbi:retrovirus-related Pol polyprotein from type-1 retrotransposable element R2 [Caerostris darwini]|uniref:Retrovirus-related Pol polyprotein from type-1 retrotransposable element R2 n=1 Tax=Caerostris darwini TaxID=1538125 RepID=A0AAV4UAL7_9ARAC|nr:retrovirus-related Pol polyprotein from type-1 retrotransposable element R2 [Caerostris darwini]